MNMTKTLCWKCEGEIPHDLFSPFLYDEGIRASACKKHATHIWRLTVNKESTLTLIEEEK